MKDLICLFLYSLFIELVFEGVKVYIDKKEIYLNKKKRMIVNIVTLIITVLLFLGIIYLMEYLDPNLLDLVEL